MHITAGSFGCLEKRGLHLQAQSQDMYQGQRQGASWTICHLPSIPSILASWGCPSPRPSPKPTSSPPSPGSFPMSLDKWTVTFYSKSPMDREPAGSPAHLNCSKSHSVLFILTRTCCLDASICQSCVSSPQSAAQNISLVLGKGDRPLHV